MRNRIFRLLTIIAGITALFAMPAFANHVDHANVTLNCTNFTIQLDGSELTTPGATFVVTYYIILTPINGTPGNPITINGSAQVTPDANFKFSLTESKPWADFGLTLTGSYAISGGATFYTNNIFENTIPI